MVERNRSAMKDDALIRDDWGRTPRSAAKRAQPEWRVNAPFVV